MAPNAVNLRPAKVEDADRLEQLINTAFRNDTTTQVFLSTDHARVDVTSAKAIAAKIIEPQCSVVVGTDAAGTIVSHCSVRKLDDSRAWFGLLAVDVSQQNRGVGSQMLAHAEELARRNWGSSRLEFDVVNTRAELIAWYMARGYRPTGKTTPFPYEYHGDWQGVLRHDLHFILLGKDLTEAAAAE